MTTFGDYSAQDIDGVDDLESINPGMFLGMDDDDEIEIPEDEDEDGLDDDGLDEEDEEY